MSGGAEKASATMPRRALPQLRVTRFEDYPQIERLESSHGLLTLPADRWRAIWTDNPLRARLGQAWPIGWVLEEASGKIVGSLANIPSLYRFGARELIAATGRAWVVGPEYRGVALWLMDEYFNQQRADLFINTTVNSMAVDPFSAFGSVRVPVGDWESAAYWITGYTGFARSALRIKRMPLAGVAAPFAAAALRLKDAATVKSLPKAAGGVVVAQADAFDPQFDGFWDELVGLNPHKLLGVRDRRTLSWHFAGPIKAGQVWILTAARNGIMRAYAILKRQDHPPSGLVRMRLVDYQTAEPEADLLSELLRMALTRCKAAGVYTLEHVGCGLPKTEAFDRFAPYRRKLPAWPYYYHATDPAIGAELRKPEAWDPSTFDGDASL